MAKPIPSIGDQNWGGVLNSHLAQLSSSTTGGINTFASDPSTVGWGANEIGYTFVNSTTKEMKRWNGASFDIIDLLHN